MVSIGRRSFNSLVFNERGLIWDGGKYSVKWQITYKDVLNVVEIKSKTYKGKLLMNYTNLKLLVLLLILSFGLNSCGTNKTTAKTPTEPQHVAWGKAGQEGNSKDVINNYDWFCADS